MFGKRVAILFACIAFLLLVGLVSVNLIEITTEGYQHYYSYQDADHKTFNPASFYRLTIESAEAFWTAIASLIGIIGSAMLYLQILSSNAAVEETKKGVQETKRSVDAMIEANSIARESLEQARALERAKLKIESISVADEDAHWGDDWFPVSITIKNEGRDHAQLHSIRYTFGPEGHATARAMILAEGDERPLSGSVSSGQRLPIIVQAPFYTFLIDSHMSVGPFWFACEIRFITLGRTFAHRLSWRHRNGDVYGETIFGWAGEFDITPSHKYV
ncbi:MAG: hypothetical protein JNM62_10190 [Flavobacteriales bacterium]|nr:hypothetical protein [Flavobacteriales bacterium]